MKLKPTVVILARTALPLIAGFAFLVCLIGVIAFMAGVFQQKIPGEEALLRPRPLPQGAQTDKVQLKHKEYFEQAVGSLKAASRTEISSRILATINKIDVTAGQTVKADQPLIELDGRDLQAQEKLAREQLEAARALAAKAEEDYGRYSTLFQKKVISREQMDQAIANLRVARAKVSELQQELARVGVLRSYTTIRAPRDGMIVDRWAEPGDTARPGVPLLSLYDPASLRLEVPVMENLAIKLKKGDVLKVHIDALGEDVDATIDEIVPQAEQASRSFLVKVRLPRLERLREGMAGRLQIPAGSRDHLCLNTAAIERIGQLQFVDVVVRDPPTKQRTIQRRLIQTGRFGMPGHIEVLSGLKAGDEVVLKSSADTREAPPSDGSPTAGNDG